MLITLIILVLSAAFFVAGKVRSDIVALCALIGLLIFQILTPEERLFRLLQLGGDYDGGLVRCGRRHFSDRAG